MIAPAQAEWLSGVLGVALGAAAEVDGAAPLEVWRDAKEVLDRQISALQAAFPAAPGLYRRCCTSSTGMGASRLISVITP